MSKVPNGWAFSTVGDACTIRNNLRFPINSDERESIKGCFPYFGPTGILSFINDYKIDDNFALIGEDGDHFLKFKEKEMTLFFSGKANVNNHAHIICDSILCKARWFYFSFMHADITSHLTRQGAKRYKLTKASLEKLPILIPPLPEQIKIAEILSTWDNAINTVQKLLTNSQQQKKALMQQLLTGKKRLLDKNGVRFSGEWKKLAIGKLIKELKKEKISNPNEMELLTVKLHYKGVIRTGKYPNATERGRPYFKRYAGELIIGRQNLHNGGVAIVSKECDGLIASNAISSFKANNISDINFILAFMSTEYFRFTVNNLAGGTGQKEIGVKDILSLPVIVPPLEEQQKIAAVLTTADQEIDNLRAQLNHLKQEKKALMQQLLTGKRRVKVEEAA